MKSYEYQVGYKEGVRKSRKIVRDSLLKYLNPLLVRDNGYSVSLDVKDCLEKLLEETKEE